MKTYNFDKLYIVLLYENWLHEAIYRQIIADKTKNADDIHDANLALSNAIGFASYG